MEEFEQNINIDIYNDLKKRSWVKGIYPTAESFNFKDFDTEKWYFQYLNSQSFIDTEYVIFKTGFINRVVKNILFLAIAGFALYKSFQYSFFLGYMILWVFILLFMAGNFGRYLETNKLSIDNRGLEIDDSTFLYWDDILYTIVINYKFNQEYPINYFYIILKSGVWYKIDFYRFEGLFKNYKTFPVYIEYFKDRHQRGE